MDKPLESEKEASDLDVLSPIGVISCRSSLTVLDTYAVRYLGIRVDGVFEPRNSGYGTRQQQGQRQCRKHIGVLLTSVSAMLGARPS